MEWGMGDLAQGEGGMAIGGGRRENEGGGFG